jgi:uncharacterized RDD family membrane protein YckC
MTFNSDQSSVPYASFWQRAIAFLIDGVILYIVNTVVGGMFKLSTSITDVKDLLISCLIAILIGWTYYSIQESSSQRATLGKRAIGLQVTDVNGNQISLWRSTRRYFSAYLSALLLFIGYLMVPFTPKHQALHDLMAGTVVTRLSSRAYD